MVMYRNLTAGVYQIILHAHRAYTILNELKHVHAFHRFRYYLHSCHTHARHKIFEDSMKISDYVHV